MPFDGPSRDRAPRAAMPPGQMGRPPAWATGPTRAPTGQSGAVRPAKPPRRGMLIALGLALLLAPAVGMLALWPHLPRSTQGSKPSTIFPWTHATTTTPINIAQDGFAQATYAVDDAFQSYVSAQTSPDILGSPITPGFLAQAGWVQFFANGALITLGGKAAPGKALGDRVFSLLGKTSAGVTHLPLTGALLVVGARVEIGPNGSGFTFADLRETAQDDDLIAGTAATPPASAQQPVFIPVTTSGTHPRGHIISPEVWAWLTTAGRFSDGWQTALGVPITEPVSTTVLLQGDTHRLTFQGFWNGVVVVDHDASGSPAISLDNVGLDYLRTLGPPTPTPQAGKAWLTGDSVVLDAPATGKATVHLGANFPVSLTSGATWAQATLCYKLSWATNKRQGSGWVSAGTVTRKVPDASAQPTAGLDALSPELAAYANGFGENMGVVIRDVTRHVTYTYHPDLPYTLASGSKIYVLLAYLDWVEGQHRELRTDEINNLTAMIETSDNPATDAVFYAMGSVSRMRQFLHTLGSDAFFTVKNDWGGETASTPATMAMVLGKLQSGAILTAAHRQFALTLLSHIEPDQQFGIGVTAPPGAQWYMKAGWIDYPISDVWSLNTSGIVVTSTDTYVITIFMKNQTYNWEPINHMAGAAASLLP